MEQRYMLFGALAFALLLATTTGAAWAEETEAGLARIASPDGRLVFSLHEGRFGGLTWSLRFGDELLVEHVARNIVTKRDCMVKY